MDATPLSVSAVLQVMEFGALVLRATTNMGLWKSQVGTHDTLGWCMSLRPQAATPLRYSPFCVFVKFVNMLMRAFL